MDNDGLPEAGYSFDPFLYTAGATNSNWILKDRIESYSARNLPSETVSLTTTAAAAAKLSQNCRFE